jgi:acyl dehydratase
MPGMDVQAAYEAVSRRTGRSYQRDLGEIRTMDLQRFAVSVGDNLPTTMDPAAAAAAGLPAIAAPPLFLSAVMGWESGPPESELWPDGAAPDGLADLPVGGLRLMGGGQSLEFYRPVVAGTKVIQQTRIRDVQLKDGHSGQLLLIQVERVFLSDGQTLVRCVETFIGR